MPRTQQDLINGAYADITLSREPPPDDDAVVIAGRVSARLSDLSDRAGVYISDTDYIPDEMFPHVVRIIAEDIAPQFGGRPRDENAILVAEARLRALKRPAPKGVLRVEYF